MSDRTPQQRAFFVAAILGVILMIAGFAWLAGRPSLSLLYANLDSAQAGQLVQRIEAKGLAYKVVGDAIWVPATERDKLRVELAAEGLPDSGTTGYEILDGMSGFGTTSQMFDAAYWRAKEGELARTILAVPNVGSARVHLAVEKAQGYRREASGRASVTLTTEGTGIDVGQSDALRYLVASAVPGMRPEDVTIIDTRHGLIGSSDDRSHADRAEQMKRNVERILEPHVGIGNAIVELNLDLITETELLTEQRFDPDQRALISQVTEETSDQSSSLGSGAVTAASNLPDAEENAGDRSESARSENRQQANYEVSQMTREVSRQPGAIKRVTVAVLINGAPKPQADGTIEIIARPEAELENLRDLVAATVGYDETRGDRITVKSLPFETLADTGSAAAMSRHGGFDLNALARIALIGAFAVLILFVGLRQLSRQRLPASQPARIEGQIARASLQAPETVEAVPAPEAQQIADLPTIRPAQLSLPPADPVARLRGMMRERHDESVKILSGWIENKGGSR